MKKNDIILIGIILVISIVALGTIKLFQSRNDSEQSVIVKQNGVIIKSYPFNAKTNEEFLYDENGKMNKILIVDGRVTMSAANCRDQICVKSHPIDENGEIIVCLPHKLTVEIFSEKTSDDNGLDSIAD